jgi:hypothetical protein
MLRNLQAEKGVRIAISPVMLIELPIAQVSITEFYTVEIMKFQLIRSHAI